MVHHVWYADFSLSVQGSQSVGDDVELYFIYNGHQSIRRNRFHEQTQWFALGTLRLPLGKKHEKRQTVKAIFTDSSENTNCGINYEGLVSLALW